MGIDYTDKDDDQLRSAIETELNKSRQNLIRNLIRKS
jgi:hypothetical protein